MYVRCDVQSLPEETLEEGFAVSVVPASEEIVVVQVVVQGVEAVSGVKSRLLGHDLKVGVPEGLG